MQICKITGYGLWDSAVKRPDLSVTKPRILKRYELEYYLSASDDAKITIDGREYVPMPGTLFFGKPGQCRSSVLGFRCLCLHVLFPEDSPYPAALADAPDFYQIIDSDRYASIFESLILHLNGDRSAPFSDLINARLLEIVYLLQRDAQTNRNCPAFFDRSRSRFIPQTVEFIRENYASRLTLADLAAVAGYSPNYFHHVFTTVMGRTPQQYLLEERIRAAKRLLVQGELPLSEIAYACGFSSQSHFCQQFKQITHTTPMQYRKLNMGDEG